MQEGETQKWMRLNERTSGAMFPKRGSARMSVYSELWHYYWNWHVSMEIAAPYMVLMSRSQERGCWQLIIKGDWLARALQWGGERENGRLRLAKPLSLHWLESSFLATYDWGLWQAQFTLSSPRNAIYFETWLVWAVYCHKKRKKPWIE